MRATNPGPGRTEMGIYELTELDSSVRSNVIGGFWLKHCPESSECPVTFYMIVCSFRNIYIKAEK